MREKLLWLLTITAFILSVAGLFRSTKSEEVSEPTKVASSLSLDREANNAFKHPELDQKIPKEAPAGDRPVLIQQAEQTDAIPFKKLSRDEQERVLADELDKTRSLFDKAFEADRTERKSEWSFEKEEELEAYVHSFQGAAVSEARCNWAMCRARLKFDNALVAERFFSRESRKDNPWAQGRLKAIRNNPFDQSDVSIYAIPDKSRKQDWDLRQDAPQQ